ncbi:hypothetical protein [Mycobacterium interjectum]|uniref:hypothetical protein n=1 Tax=Mycobacterium interjectum TaxID=33895 RepID=UPI001F2E9422|nr:hypothetical protein [Mycobacterium interjectum]
MTPVLGAAIGTLITAMFPYGVLSMLLVVALCVLLVVVLRSNIAPAIAAGVLPLFLGIKTWMYPASIAVSLVVLVVILLPWRRRFRPTHHDLDDALEARPGGSSWVLPFFVFVTAMALCAATSGLRLILFPPLIVIAYEMFAHPTVCPWAGKPVALPAACFLTATAGWAAVSVLGSGGIAAACAMASGVIVLRLLRLHMPPALAVGLLPLVIHSPDVTYPVSVAIGTGALTLATQLYQRWVIRQGRAGRNMTDLRSARCRTAN